MNKSREALKKLSETVKPAVVSGDFKSVNDAIKAIYARDGHTELHTMETWNQRGQWVRSGEKALTIWGKKVTVNNAKGDYEFTPVVYLFSQQQLSKYQPA